jgi:hypothetical protein
MLVVAAISSMHTVHFVTPVGANRKPKSVRANRVNAIISM